jgi:uncharacterized protein YndB with AHSA1/START domain
MKQQPFVIERVYQAPVEKVWQALTDKKKMKEWYFDLAEFEPEVGFEFSFWGGAEDKQYLHLCKVTAAIPNKKIAYTWRYEGYEGNSEVSFELFAEGDQTRMILTHTGLESFPKDDKNFARESFAAGWTELMGTLLPNYLTKH